ncbi:hypothetical protein BLSTO_02770 [Blastocystis sp. subtype 1]
MNQTFANKLNEEGAILLILDMPKGAEIGIDYNSWLVGESFLGFKMINPGFHCLFYSSVSKEHEFSPRTIIPLFLQSQEVMVLQYDKREECLLREEQMDASLVAKYKAGGPCGLLSLLAGKSFAYDAQTAPYPFETIGKWMNMTNAITKELFDRLTDASSISFILDSNSPHRFNYSSTVNITELLQHPNPSLMARLYVDTTQEVVKLVASYPFRFKYPSLHGEFQFAFVMFHLGEDYESLLQWKNLLFLLTGAYSLVTNQEDLSVGVFYEAFMKTLYFQISELEEDFFTLSEGGKRSPAINRKNFVLRCLESLKDIVAEEPQSVIPAVVKELARIESLLSKRFHITLERTSDTPTIVN